MAFGPSATVRCSRVLLVLLIGSASAAHSRRRHGSNKVLSSAEGRKEREGANLMIYGHLQCWGESSAWTKCWKENDLCRAELAKRKVCNNATLTEAYAENTKLRGEVEAKKKEYGKKCKNVKQKTMNMCKAGKIRGVGDRRCKMVYEDFDSPPPIPPPSPPETPFVAFPPPPPLYQECWEENQALTDCWKEIKVMSKMIKDESSTTCRDSALTAVLDENHELRKEVNELQSFFHARLVKFTIRQRERCRQGKIYKVEGRCVLVTNHDQHKPASWKNKPTNDGFDEIEAPLEAEPEMLYLD